MIKIIVVLISFYVLLQGKIIMYDIKPLWLKSSKFMNINILVVASRTFNEVI